MMEETAPAGADPASNDEADSNKSVFDHLNDRIEAQKARFASENAVAPGDGEMTLPPGMKPTARLDVILREEAFAGNGTEILLNGQIAEALQFMRNLEEWVRSSDISMHQAIECIGEARALVRDCALAGEAVASLRSAAAPPRETRQRMVIERVESRPVIDMGGGGPRALENE